jgi:hypothetical protein
MEEDLQDETEFEAPIISNQLAAAVPGGFRNLGAVSFFTGSS